MINLINIIIQYIYNELYMALNQIPMLETNLYGFSLSEVISTFVTVFLFFFVLLAPIIIVYKALRRLWF